MLILDTLSHRNNRQPSWLYVIKDVVSVRLLTQSVTYLLRICVYEARPRIIGYSAPQRNQLNKTGGDDYQTPNIDARARDRTEVVRKSSGNAIPCQPVTRVLYQIGSSLNIYPLRFSYFGQQDMQSLSLGEPKGQLHFTSVIYL